MAIYVLRTGKTKPGTWREFQELSQREIWPALEAAAAKIIGLWSHRRGQRGRLVTRYDDLSMWERTRAWSRPAPEGDDVERRAAEAVVKRQALTESTHARVLRASEYRAP